MKLVGELNLKSVTIRLGLALREFEIYIVRGHKNEKLLYSHFPVSSAVMFHKYCLVWDKHYNFIAEISLSFLANLWHLKPNFCNTTICCCGRIRNRRLIYDYCHFFCGLSPVFKTNERAFCLSQSRVKRQCPQSSYPFSRYESDFIKFRFDYAYKNSGGMYRNRKLSL